MDRRLGWNSDVNAYPSWYCFLLSWCYLLTGNHWMQIITVCNEKKEGLDDKKILSWKIGEKFPCNILFMGLTLRSSSFETDKIASSNNSSCSKHDQHSMETAFCPPLGEKLPKVICSMGLKNQTCVQLTKWNRHYYFNARLPKNHQTFQITIILQNTEC